LIFEISENNVDTIKENLLNIMKNVYKLDVPLDCSVCVAKSWGGLK
jgi:DNA polymerase I-like protein with 3'-5' exonuclease and polymerase domains